ncbi:MAG TPA: peptide deformylase [Candidatus Omnitrophota bacterium]|nr:peptide deformylase [Candidatus Omnitrophota bacterium]HQL41976.1 peptide deformylase [Candidatus Omnitrophota bacterium]
MITTKLKIRTFGDPCLRQRSACVKKVGPAERMLIEAMLATIGEKETDIGLAAPQIGINKQIFVVDLPDFPHVFVDPKITRTEGKETMEEGCLSFPGIAFKVTRPRKIWLDYLDEYNNPRHLECEGFYARVVLHETDHLNGKLLVDHATRKEAEEKKDLLGQLENKTREALKANG